MPCWRTTVMIRTAGRTSCGADVDVVMVRLADDPVRIATKAAALIAAAFPVPSLEMTGDYLTWLLGAEWTGSPRALAATAFDRDVLVGFAAAVPRPLEFAGTPEWGYVVSFVAVHPDFRGAGLSRELYRALLEPIAAAKVPVLTFAVAESAGAHAITVAYPRAGFVGTELAPLSAWGALRGRGRDRVSPVPVPDAPTLSLQASPEVDRYLDADPRGSVRLASGARATAAWRSTTAGRQPTVLLELLPSSLEAHAINSSVAAAFRAFPEHGRQLSVPGIFPDAADAAAEAGLRRMPGPPYRSWIWTTRAGHRLLSATRTLHPIL